MERGPEQENISHLDLDRYLEFLVSLNTLDGELIEDEDEAFYVWVTKRFPVYQNIDGVSLIDLYRKNVVNGGMEKARFFGYCMDHGFPYPSTDSEDAELVWNQFQAFLQEVNNGKKQEYEAWAKENGISTAPDTITKFYDTEGTVYRVRTDYDRSGEIV